MSSKAMSLKGKIKNYAKSNNIAAQVVLQNFMFERLLVRLSISEYRQKFILKGGMLVAAIVGLDTRSTMDLDTTLQNLPLTEEQVMKALRNICSIYVDDDITFNVLSLEPIRKDDVYGGFCVRIDAKYDAIITPLSIDVSTGDVITPKAVQYEFHGIFDNDLRINLWGYNIETVIAEKVETILRRSEFNTRPRDFYDAYILSTTQKYDRAIFRDALLATSEHRGSLDVLQNDDNILARIENSLTLRDMWVKYQKRFAYASDISYEMVMSAIRQILAK